MDERTLALIAGALILGFVVGRLSARRGDGGYVGQPPGARAAPPAATSTPASALSDAAAEEILALLRKGEKIEAIKRYRELLGSDLKGAKEAIERFERRG